MPKATVEQTDSLVQSRIEQGRVADSFLQVFGLPASRSQAQKDVIEHLRKCAGETGPCFIFQEADGYKIALAAAHRDGASIPIRVIERQIELSQKLKETKPQPITKR